MATKIVPLIKAGAGARVSLLRVSTGVDGNTVYTTEEDFKETLSKTGMTSKRVYNNLKDGVYQLCREEKVYSFMIVDGEEYTLEPGT